MAKITTLYSGTKAELEPNFKRIRSNIRRFNGGVCKYKTTTVSNGKVFEVYYKGNLIKEVAFVSDSEGWKILNISYKVD